MDDSERLNNLRFTYHTFHERVLSALRRMVGDPPQLTAVRDQGLLSVAAAEQHRAVFPVDEYNTVQTSITEIVSALDLACHESIDPPDAAPLVVVWRVRTGRRGRPGTEIDTQFLSAALELRGPTEIAPELGVSSHTVRRAALRVGLVQPGAPVFQAQVDNEGVVEHIHQSTGPPVSALSDAELDQLLSSTLEIFPQFGRRIIRGHLKAQSHRVPCERIPQSYLRMVIHCVIDGYSRFVLGICVHDNNPGVNVHVLQLFHGSEELGLIPSASNPRPGICG
ncbi:hypothetical protein DFH09DRAFT_935459 [Mycena vulgaris]|nr:hypothetical protein DFH09DRAFT_935459 [Mycena vulgaris]